MYPVMMSCNVCFTFFIPGAKMYPVMMSIQIHARGRDFFSI